MNTYTSKHIFAHEMEALDIDKSRLRDFYRSNYAALKVLDNFATRKNDSYITSVNSIVARLEGGGHPIARSDVMRVFEALQRFNCGTFIKEPTIQSAKNKQSRFEWRVSLVTTGKIARS